MKAIVTTYHGPTNTRGSRISATDGDNRVFIHYESEYNSDVNHANAAKALCKKLGWKGTMIGGGTKRGMVWVFANSPDRFTTR